MQEIHEEIQVLYENRFLTVGVAAHASMRHAASHAAPPKQEKT
jgi:hypothetical protein